MNNPMVSYIKMDCESCDIYAPDEGNCRECLLENNETFELMDESKDRPFTVKDGEQE